MVYRLRPTDLPPGNVCMGYGWQSDVYNKFISNSHYALNASNTNVHVTPYQLDVEPNFAEEISFKPLEPFTPDHRMLWDAMDPTSLWPTSMDQLDVLVQQPQIQAPAQPCNPLQTHRSSVSSSAMSIAQRRSIDRAPHSSNTPTSTPASTVGYAEPLFFQVSTPASMNSDSVVSASPIESEKTLRARYAAHQRHSKAKQAQKDSQQSEGTGVSNTRAAERRQRHREKNKVAAAKCRSRQRKQVQTIQEKGVRLGEKNVQFKTMIQELRGELNGLRSMALDH